MELEQLFLDTEEGLKLVRDEESENDLETLDREPQLIDLKTRENIQQPEQQIDEYKFFQNTTDDSTNDI